MASTSLPIGYRYATAGELLAAGKSPLSRQVITPAGDFISRRQAEKIDAQLRGFTTKEEQRATAKSSGASGISSEVESIRTSWKKQAGTHGIDTRIRNNADYQNFKQELQDLDRNRSELLRTMGKKLGQDEYTKQRLDIYLKFGLITKGEYDAYKGV